MSDLVKRLTIKAGVMEMGEKIAWGSDTSLMREAADRIKELEANLAQMQRTLDWTEDRAKGYKDGREMMGRLWSAAEEDCRKALDTMERAIFVWEQPHYGEDYDTIIDHGSEAIDMLRTTLAELKGETDE